MLFYRWLEEHTKETRRNSTVFIEICRIATSYSFVYTLDRLHNFFYFFYSLPIKQKTLKTLFNTINIRVRIP
jgi:hypothetical protein